MSVLGAEAVEFRRFSGWREPQFPEGFWHGRVTVTGDATGASANLSINLAQGGGALSSRIFNVEQMALFTDDNVARNAHLDVANLGGPTSGAFRGIIAVVLQAASGAAAIAGADYSFLPLFLGSQQRPDVGSSFSAVLPNIDTLVYVMEAEGYWWGPRSVLVPGGPQRPPTGIYGL